MSKCDLEVRFASDDRTYKPGSRVEGDVVVTVDERVSCKGLRIELGWQTHGIGNTDRRVLDQVMLEPQQWSAGQAYSYPFSFTAPSQPLTYHGHFLNVDHFVAARVDLAWKIDPKVSEDYVLDAGPSSRDDYLAACTDFSQPPAGKPSWVGKLFGWLLVPVIIVLLLALLTMLIPILLLIGAVVLVRRHLAERRLGKVMVDLDAPTVKTGTDAGGVAATASRMGSRWRRPTYALTPGESTRCRVRFTPKQDLAINGVKVTLVGKEQCRSGAGTNARTHVHKVHEEQVVLAEGASYMGRMPTEVGGTFTVPHTAAYSFKARENNLTWELQVVVDLPKWVDWKQDVRVWLVPKPGTA